MKISIHKFLHDFDFINKMYVNLNVLARDINLMYNRQVLLISLLATDAGNVYTDIMIKS